MSKATKLVVPASPPREPPPAEKGSEPRTFRGRTKCTRAPPERRAKLGQGGPPTEQRRWSALRSQTAFVARPCDTTVRTKQGCGEPTHVQTGPLGVQKGARDGKRREGWARARARVRRGYLSAKSQGPSKNHHQNNKCCQAICQQLKVMQKKPSYAGSRTGSDPALASPES